MDLLEQENNNQKPLFSGKKIVLMLLIFCIFVLIMLLVLLFVLPKGQTTKQKFSVNGAEIQPKEELIVTDETGNKYICLEDGAEVIGYRFFSGEYGKNEEDKDKCYLQNTNEIIGFELNSNEIYKTTLNSMVEPQYYKIKNTVEKQNDKLYITLEDFSIAFNMQIKASENGNQIEINSCEYLAEQYTKTIEEQKKYTGLDKEYNNLKAIYYGMLVVNDGQNYGVVDTNMNRLISPRYSNITFDEYTQNFIAVSNNKYGVISKEGKIKVEFNYEDVKIINYSPLLYKVKQNNKYGILDETGNTIINVECDEIGYNGGSETDSVLIIKNIKPSNENAIVICKDKKYGLANIKTGKIIINCELEKIYSKTSQNDEITYYIQIKGSEYTLDEYIKYINTTVVTLEE
ncbi:MAG: WG repeat-containing protein [Clostridia bacterium]|nr:WG repeat-containing protein [Clostridia bacterium]